MGARTTKESIAKARIPMVHDTRKWLSISMAEVDGSQPSFDGKREEDRPEMM
jgi:hypothetical protein